jgi:hypothetical protein
MAAGLVFGISGMVMADQDASATANTQAVVIKPITLGNSSHLNFGRLASGATETISIAADDGARTSSGTVDLVAANGGALAPSRATFAVAGEEGLTYAISGGTGNITLTNVALDTLTVALTGVYVPSKTLGAGIAAAGTLPLAGETLGVGGSLPITALTPSGTYTNTAGIALTVAYN